MSRKTSRTSILLATLFAGLLWDGAHAQYPFGQNKVVYSNKDWKVLATEHVDIYYYPDEVELARAIAPLAEETYLEFSEFFRHEFDSSVPVVLYGTHHDFKQTNIIPVIISEYTAGFTDLIKGRVALPFMGSYGQLHHVLRHELVHAFMLDKLGAVMAEHHRFGYSHPPLWFIEGLAEYVARRKPDTQHHMVVRDALLNDKFFPLQELWRINGSFLMYKEGESCVRYIATNYGNDALRLILENWWKSDQFSEVLRATIGMGLEELNEAWHESLKRFYYPAVLSTSPAKEQGKRLSSQALMNTRPVIWRRPADDGSLRSSLIYLSTSTGLIDINLVDNPDGRDQRQRGERRIVAGGRSEEFESIPPSRSGLDVRGDTLVFVSKRGENDAIYLWDLAKNREFRVIQFKDIKELNSPSLSPDGTRVVFSGLEKSGLMDIFIFDLLTEERVRLTHDIYADKDPDWHPFRDRIVFSSDRCPGGEEQRYALYEIDMMKDEVFRLTSGGHQDLNPRWSPEGESIVFSSDRDGIFNAYILKDGIISQLTRVRGGILHPDWYPDGSAIVSTVYSGAQFNVYRFALPDTGQMKAKLAYDPKRSYPSWESRRAEVLDVEYKDYKSRFSLDFIGAAIAVDPDFGSVGNGAQFVFTDVLGNHQIHALIANTSQDYDNFFRKLNLGLTYVNQSRRLGYHLSGFHLASYPRTSIDFYRFERRYGASAGLLYPISKFHRLDTSIVVRWIERDDVLTQLGLKSSRGFTISHFVSYTRDTSLWTIGGPRTGRRFNITVGNTIDPEGDTFEHHTLQVDLRHYFGLTPRIVYAVRALSRNSWGGDTQIFYLGGGWDLRGYNFRQFLGRKTLLFNNEIRFPLLDRLAIRFPFGGLEFPSFRGSIYFDAGRAWDYILDSGWVGGVGFGTELNLGYAPVLRVNVTRRLDLSGNGLPTRKNDKWHVGFFIGFNY